MVHLLEDISGNPVRGFAVVERGPAPTGDDVGDAVPQGPVVEVVVPLEGQGDPVFLEQRVEDRVQSQDAALVGSGVRSRDRLVEKGTMNFGLGPRLGEVGVEPGAPPRSPVSSGCSVSTRRNGGSPSRRSSRACCRRGPAGSPVPRSSRACPRRGCRAPDSRGFAAACRR